jgi:Ca2+-binding EF-hand superfamily protein
MAIEGISGSTNVWQLYGMGRTADSNAVGAMGKLVLSGSAAGQGVTGNANTYGDRVEISGMGRMAAMQQMQGMQQPPAQPGEDSSAFSQNMLDFLDSDGDGSLSTEELGSLSEKLSEADTDSDGLVSQEELASAFSAQMVSQSGAAPGMQGPPPPPPPDASAIGGQMLSELDADEDGLLSGEELGDLSGELSSADTDGDGLISEEELVSAISAEMESRMETASPEMQGPPPPPQMDASSVSEQMMSELDTDGDGSLSTEETSSLSGELEGADTNGDGLISREELISSISSRMEQMGGLPGMAESRPDGLNMFKQMIGMGMEQNENVSGTDNNISLITDLLGELGLSKEETENVLDIIQNARLDISA